MGAHRTNSVALANAALGPKQEVQVMDLGEDAVLLGVHLVPGIDRVKDELVILLNAVGGHASPILGAFEPRVVSLCELARAPLAKLRLALKGASPPVVETPATPSAVETPAGGAPDAPRLILGGRS